MEEARNKEKIVIAAEIYPPDIGGPATYARMLVESLRLKDYKVRLLAFGEPILRHGNDDYVVIIDRQRNVVTRFFIYLLTLIQLSRAADIIYAMGPGVSGLCSIVAGTLYRKKVVVKVTGDRAWEAAQLKGNAEGIEAFQTQRHGGYVGVLERIERWVVKRADAVIVPGNFLKRIVEGWGVRKEVIEVIPNAIDRHPPSDSPLSRGEDKARQIPLRKKGEVGGEGVNTILAIGRLVPWKGFDDLIASLPLVRHDVPDARLIIIGEGPEREVLEEQARRSEAAGHIRFMGKVPHEQLGAYWASSSVFALVSGYEGFPHLVLEAWAYGVPVVASSIQANRDILNDGETGLLVPYGDRSAIAAALVRILKDVPLPRKLSVGGKRALEKYQWEKIFDMTVKALSL